MLTHTGLEGKPRAELELARSFHGAGDLTKVAATSVSVSTSFMTEAGLRVPEDCSVAGSDDVLPAEAATPGITTIRQPLREMGLLATELMLRALDKNQRNDAQEAGLHIVQPELVPRMSSAPPVEAGSGKGAWGI